MIGVNALTLNEATVMRAIEQYLNGERLYDAPMLRVTSVSVTTLNTPRQFIVTVAAEPDDSEDDS